MDEGGGQTGFVAEALKEALLLTEAFLEKLDGDGTSKNVLPRLLHR